jgi:DNA-binding transcriptional ArsR family regulator
MVRGTGSARERERDMGWYPRARDEGIISEEVGDELMVYVEATRTAHALSADAVSVWRRCDGHSSAKEIARRVGLEQPRVAQALDELSGAGLIEEQEGISRRALYKRIAKLGAAAVSAPLIYSIAVPAPGAAASSTCGTFRGRACVVLFENADCSGSQLSDSCTDTGAPGGCTCQNLGQCSGGRLAGTCM